MRRYLPPRVAAIVAVMLVVVAGGADSRHPAVEWLNRRAKSAILQAEAWYRRTPADERVAWGGLAACGAFGLLVAMERLAVVRRRRIIPRAYEDRFHARLVEGKLDRGKALDYCELNPSPASRVALAAIRRWGRPAADLERGADLARQREVDRLRRNVGTLRRLAALSPLIGLLGTLHLANRALSTAGAAWGPGVGAALAPLTAGVALAILCLVAYDGLTGRVDAISATMDRLAAEAVDAIALAAPIETATRTATIRREKPGSPQAPHKSRAEIPLEAD